LYPITLEALGFQERATLCCPDDCVPSPVNDCVNIESEASLENEILPEEVPAVGGVNMTEYVALLPAATVTGNVMPLTEYPDPLQAAEETVTSAFLADKVPVKDELLPTATFPKFSEDGDTASAPAALLGGWLLELEDTPEQPTSIPRPISPEMAPMKRKRTRCSLSMQRLSAKPDRWSREHKSMTILAIGIAL
jgi:hypothetical protein